MTSPRLPHIRYSVVRHPLPIRRVRVLVMLVNAPHRLGCLPPALLGHVLVANRRKESSLLAVKARDELVPLSDPLDLSFVICVVT